MKEISVLTKEPYKVFIGENLLEKAASTLKEYGSVFAIIADSRVASLYGDETQTALDKHGIKTSLFTFPAGEKYKTRETKEKLEDQMLEAGIDRKSSILSLGGGVTGDLAGFIAATYQRGIPYINMPTTLLSMVDSSVGGKTGVNTSFGKNMIGTIYQPKAVFIDTRYLESLPRKEITSAMAEVIKYALIFDKELFSLLEDDRGSIEEVIHRSIAIKAKVVAQDEYDAGIRCSLNFGHTVGHAIEKYANYQISHGDAIHLGMQYESFMAKEIGSITEEEHRRICHLIERFYPAKSTFSYKELSSLISRDKKGRNFILLKAIGKLSEKLLHPVSEELLFCAHNFLKS